MEEYPRQEGLPKGRNTIGVDLATAATLHLVRLFRALQHLARPAGSPLCPKRTPIGVRCMLNKVRNLGGGFSLVTGVFVILIIDTDPTAIEIIRVPP